MFFRMMWLKNRLGVAFGGGVNTLKHWQQPLVLKVLRMNLNKDLKFGSTMSLKWFSSTTQSKPITKLERILT